MRLTKETQFGRIKRRNLPELLTVILDGSAPYKDKLIEVGNNRAAVLRRARSKYCGHESKVSKEQTVDLGEGTFMVQSEGEPNTWYTLDMKTGFCTCAREINCAPCKHKHTKIQFTTTLLISVCSPPGTRVSRPCTITLPLASPLSRICTGKGVTSQFPRSRSSLMKN